MAVLTVAAVDAQVRRGNTITERTKFGVKAGLSASSQTLEEYGAGIATYDTKAGVVAGVEAEVPIKNGWYLQPEVNYANMGTRSYEKFNNSQTGQDEWGTIKYANNYVQVPVLVKFRPLYSGFGIYAGPQLGINVQAKENPIGYEPVVTTNEYAKAEIAGVFGMEYYIPNSDDRAPRFGFSARYLHGFSNIYPQNSAKASSASLRNSGFQITAGVRF